MKKLKLSLLLIFFFSSYLIGQNKIVYSLGVAPSLSHIPNYDRGYYSSHKLSINLGLSAEKKIAPNTAFMASLTLINTGGRKKERYDPKTRTVSINYLTPSIGAKHYFGKFYLSVEIGLNLFLFSSESEYYDDHIDIRVDLTAYETGVSRVSTSYLMNIGYEFPWKKKTFFTGIKSYVMLDSYSNSFEEYKLFPYGIGVLFGMKL